MPLAAQSKASLKRQYCSAHKACKSSMTLCFTGGGPSSGADTNSHGALFWSFMMRSYSKEGLLSQRVARRAAAAARPPATLSACTLRNGSGMRARSCSSTMVLCMAES